MDNVKASPFCCHFNDVIEKVLCKVHSFFYCLAFLSFCCQHLESLIASFENLVHRMTQVFTTRSELRKVLFLMPSVCGFLFVYEISREPLNSFVPLCQIHTEDVFGRSLGQV